MTPEIGQIWWLYDMRHDQSVGLVLSYLINHVMISNHKIFRCLNLETGTLFNASEGRWKEPAFSDLIGERVF